MLELHLKNENSRAVMKSFGDPFLLKHNSIYRTVRLKAEACGFNFQIGLDPDFLALPLSQLESLLHQKKILYSDNVSTLVKIESHMPHLTQWDEVYDNLKRNFIFHESCHAVARAGSIEVFGEPSGERRLIQVLIEESFANTCELLGISEVEDTAHEIFYEFNSYIFIYEIKSLVQELQQRIGFDKLFKMVWLSYLHSNFLFNRLDEKSFKRLCAYLQLDKSLALDEAKKLKSLLRVTFELNPRFKEVTTAFYLRYTGLTKPNQNINQIDFMKQLESDVSYSDYFTKICHLFENK